MSALEPRGSMSDVVPVPERLQFLDPRGLLGIAPVVAYLVVRQIGEAPLAIGAGFGVALIVFALNRRSNGPVLQMLSLLGLLAITVGATAGMALGSEKAFLANDFVGDYLMAGLLAASLLAGRPIAGAVSHELLPRVRSLIPLDDPLFVRLTLAYIVSNVVFGTFRLLLLLEAGPAEYVLYSRAVTMPLGALMLATAGWLVLRTVSGRTDNVRPSLS